MRVADVGRSAYRVWVLACAGAFLSLGWSLFAPTSTETAVANGDTRTLHLYHTHTGETIDATFRVDGHYDAAVLRQLNHFLRDWRNNDEISMDPRLFDTLWEVYRTAGATDPIQIYSAYRSPETNAMLRRRSRAVAEHSQHMLGKAMDTTIPGFPMDRIRDIGMKLQHGGVGWYPSANFVHLDVGGVRSWPRMSYDQLSRLFPDGKTVHIASNGQVLPGYEAARAEIAAHGGVELPPAQESEGFFAWLFGGGTGGGAAREDEEDRRTAVAVATPPARKAARFQQAAIASAAPEPASDPRPMAGVIDQSQVQAPVPQPEPRQLASADDEPVATLPLPLPPRRPVDLVALADIPLPPTRPDSLAPFQTASVRFTTGGSPGDHINSSSAARPGATTVVRTAQLPSIITDGDRGRSTAPTVLAYAEPVPGDRIAPVPATVTPAARQAAAKPVGLRSALHADRAPPMPKPLIAATNEMPLGVSPRLTGLRRAAHLLAENAAL